MPRLKFVPPLVAATAAMAMSAPASAQMDHSMPGMTMPMPTRKPPAKKPSAKKAAKKAPAKKPALKKAPAKSAPKKPAAKGSTPKAGHDMSSMPGMTMPPGHDMSSMPGMTMPAQPGATSDAHGGHDMGAMPGMGEAPSGTALPAGNAPPPPVPADHAADAVYGAEAMAMGRHHLTQFHGGQNYSLLLANVLEAQVRDGRDGYQWDAEASYGGDINRLWLKSEGEGEFGRSPEKGEVQALFSHAIDPYFNLQGGVRYDLRPSPNRVYATVGVEGLAPGFFEVEGALFLSNKGELMGRLEGYYDQRITQRLILQPRAELNFAAQSSREIGVGKGLSEAELGLRLRYDIRREFAPYVGVQYRRAFGDTARYLRDSGANRGGLEFVTGVRAWF